MDSVVVGIQLPTDGSGKRTAAIKLEGATALHEDPSSPDDVDLYIPASVIVDANGVEIGSTLLSALDRVAALLEELRDLHLLSTAALTS